MMPFDVSASGDAILEIVHAWTSTQCVGRFGSIGASALEHRLSDSLCKFLSRREEAGHGALCGLLDPWAAIGFGNRCDGGAKCIHACVLRPWFGQHLVKYLGLTRCALGLRIRRQRNDPAGCFIGIRLHSAQLLRECQANCRRILQQQPHDVGTTFDQPLHGFFPADSDTNEELGRQPPLDAFSAIDSVADEEQIVGAVGFGNTFGLDWHLGVCDGYGYRWAASRHTSSPAQPCDDA
ncbi:hypothetical protein BH10PSE18_BH10PSE18_16890 [soil metagenome]